MVSCKHENKYAYGYCKMSYLGPLSEAFEAVWRAYLKLPKVGIDEKKEKQ